jgi:sec-independent protein translocase protein TatA
VDVLQPTHLIFILVVALLVLGPKRLPEVGRSLGKGLRDFRGALSGITDPDEDSSPTEPASQMNPVTPVTPATTSLPDEDAPEAPNSTATVDQSPAVTPSVSEDAQIPGSQGGSSLLPHVEPDETYPLSPAASSTPQD